MSLLLLATSEFMRYGELYNLFESLFSGMLSASVSKEADAHNCAMTTNVEIGSSKRLPLQHRLRLCNMTLSDDDYYNILVYFDDIQLRYTFLSLSRRIARIIIRLPVSIRNFFKATAAHKKEDCYCCSERKENYWLKNQKTIRSQRQNSWCRSKAN